MTVYYLILGLEIVVVVLVSGFLIRKISSIYREKRNRKRNTY
ncbi:MAG: hypothetical protein R3209_00695 [Salinimicrobium sediminis]|uniref:Uncharacterized protein n=1 Tax=Salinimicrobium sediminis TaxID=1343891 RepID=A0A285X557_9FLAO|nr:hypothetical protein [Salinimicrobium sediminis]MDX1751724.1 hypothetical protein [Salinimicrobium sediminis]SOC80470.1 hypothetical protein SAMN06296241_2020 [Salinimicrobium sediminis]